MAPKENTSSKKAKKTTPKKTEPAPAPVPVVEETPVEVMEPEVTKPVTKKKPTTKKKPATKKKKK